MKVLYLSFYFEPDLSAGSFRNSALLRKLIEKLPAGSEVDVITTMPNRYKSFEVSAPEFEKIGCASIHRIRLPDHSSGIKDQSLAFMTFAAGANKIVKGRSYDLVFASSGRLMTAALASIISRRVKAPLYLDIRDIFVDTIKDVLQNKYVSKLIEFTFNKVERFTFKRANKINLVSEGFSDYFLRRYPEKDYSFYKNGIEDCFVTSEQMPCEPGETIRVVYAGNIGEGQGLHHILPPLAKKLGERVVFEVYGDGGRREHLQSALKEEAVSNVKILSPVQREELVKIYQSADILFLHLNDLDAFRKVLPSKLFEYAAIGKPMMAGVAGYSSTYIRDSIDNAYVFPPCNVEEAVRVFNQIEFRPANRQEFIAQNLRDNVMNEMADDILSIAD